MTGPCVASADAPTLRYRRASARCRARPAAAGCSSASDGASDRHRSAATRRCAAGRSRRAVDEHQHSTTSARRSTSRPRSTTSTSHDHHLDDDRRFRTCRDRSTSTAPVVGLGRSVNGAPIVAERIGDARRPTGRGDRGDPRRRGRRRGDRRRTAQQSGARGSGAVADRVDESRRPGGAAAPERQRRRPQPELPVQVGSDRRAGRLAVRRDRPSERTGDPGHRQLRRPAAAGDRHLVPPGPVRDQPGRRAARGASAPATRS